MDRAARDNLTKAIKQTIGRLDGHGNEIIDDPDEVIAADARSDAKRPSREEIRRLAHEAADRLETKRRRKAE
jgi:hypothetical protein